MAKRIELSGAAGRALDRNSKSGWMRDADDLEIGELERASFVYDGAITGAGYEWLKGASRRQR